MRVMPGILVLACSYTVVHSYILYCSMQLGIVFKCYLCSKHKDIPDNPEEPIRSPDEDDSSDEDEPVNEQDPEPDPELDPDFCQLNWSCFRKVGIFLCTCT